MENNKKEILQRLKDANNVLVTVSQNPSVDQLSAAIGMTLVLNKLGKHGTAVFSGATPSTIEFLKPEETLEKTTDSLRDFIIALDKAKADKLRYKVEDQHVKIFITPYRTTITEDDLVFSHGDFNVDVVLALGVHVQKDLDQAITAHGRILHDATVISINSGGKGELGGINYENPEASSLSEILAGLSIELKEDVFDSQTATAFLTGIVSETDRFSNEKTKPATMSVSAKLMAAGANQQLVATKLEEPEQPPEPEAPEPLAQNEEVPQPTEPAPPKNNDGSLEIDHSEEQQEQEALNKIHIDEHGNVKDHSEAPQSENPPEENDPDVPEKDERIGPSRMILEPPSRSGTLTASDKDNEIEPSTDSLSLPSVQGPTLSHTPMEYEETPSPSSSPEEKPEPPQPATTDSQESQQNDTDATMAAEATNPIQDSQTLDDLERAVDSPHQEASVPSDNAPQPQEALVEKLPAPDLDDLQSAVDTALKKGEEQGPLEPIAALNANPVNLDLGHDEPPTVQDPAPQPEAPTDDYLDVSSLDTSSGEPRDSENTSVDNPSAPPPVPPPMMPPSPHRSDDDMNLPPVPQ